MAIIVEDGTIVDNANSFVSLTDAQSFVDLRGFDVTLTDGMLLRAMDTLQPMSCLDKYLLPLSDALEVNPMLVTCQIWLAYYMATGEGVDTAATGSGVLREKVAEIEVEYSESDIKTGVSLADLPNVASALRALGCSSTGQCYTVSIGRH